MKIKQNLDEVIYSQIIDSLILHKYEMGEQILLDTLAENYGVSRTPVVQAVRLLANDGVLDLQRNGRVRVPVFTPAEVKQILDTRLLLEDYAIDELEKKKAAEDYDEWCKKLEEIADTCRLHIQQDDILNFNRYDLKFHTHLVKGSGNPFLVDLYKRIQGRFVVANYLSSSWTNRDFSAADTAHHRIVNALEQCDFAACKEILREHIYSIYLLIIGK